MYADRAEHTCSPARVDNKTIDRRKGEIGDRIPITSPHNFSIFRNSFQASASRPCFSTTASSLSAIPLGRFAPVSHFSIVDSLVLR